MPAFQAGRCGCNSSTGCHGLQALRVTHGFRKPENRMRLPGRPPFSPSWFNAERRPCSADDAGATPADGPNFQERGVISQHSAL